VSKIVRFLFLLAFIALALMAFLILSKPNAKTVVVTTTNSPDAVRILFVGNNLNQTISLVFSKLIEAGLEQPAKIVMVYGPNFSFEDHYKKAAALEAIEKAGPWDYVLLQGKSGYSIFTTDAFQSYGRLLINRVRRSNAVPVLLEAASFSDDDAEMLKMIGEYRDLAQREHTLLVPLGEAWIFARNNSLVKIFEDDRHLTPAGSYFTACTLYEYIFHKNPSGLPTVIEVQDPGTKESRILINLTPDEAEAMQNLAWKQYSLQPKKKVDI
jgi:hypothetical protein